MFRLDRNSLKMRVQFKIQKGSFDKLVNELDRGEEQIQHMRDMYLGKWIIDDIDERKTWLQVVAVEINTENVASTNKRSSSKKQEIFGAKVKRLYYFFMMIDFHII